MKSKDKGDTSQIYLISPTGGEAFPITTGDEDVHDFSWSADSRTIYFATRTPWSKAQKDDYKKEWKDVVQYRTAERGDTIYALDLAAAIERHAAAPAKVDSDAEKDAIGTPGARAIATTPLRVDDLVTSPEGNRLAFASNSINQRQEKVEDVEIYVIDLASASPANAPRALTHNQAVEGRLHWANDSRHIFFSVEVGDVTGPYRDLQPHLYWVDSDGGVVQQWSKDFIGPVEHYAVAGRKCTRRRPGRNRSPTLFRRQAFGITASRERMARLLRGTIRVAAFLSRGLRLHFADQARGSLPCR